MLSIFLVWYLTNFRHRKTHERTGTTHSPSARNTPCDSARNTPVSGDEELDGQRPDESDQFRYEHQSNGTEFPYPQQQPLHHSHFRSFSHDGHLNHYGITPTSNGLNFNNVNRSTPPNEVEEDSHQTADDDNSPTDSDGSHSYHEDAPPSYAHQTNYHGMPVGNTTLGLTSNGDIKNGITMMQPDPLRKNFLSHTQMMDPSMMNQGWEYH